MTVENGWIDYNGHLNMAYYHVLFDRAVDELFALLGVGAAYVAERNASFFVLESHTSYLRELKAGDRVAIDIQLLDQDGKRIHIFETMVAVDGGFVAATCEQAAVHIDLATRKSAPIPPDVLPRIAARAGTDAALPRPEGAGRSVGLRKRNA